MPCKLPPALYAAVSPLLQGHEGYRRYPYTDTVGKCSIGIGRNLSDVGLSDAEVLYLFNNDLDAALQACQRLVPRWDALSVPRQAALLDMAFNLGAARMAQFTQTLLAINEARYTDATQAMRNSK